MDVTKLGNSFEVPFVQELAKNELSHVPPRYVRPDHQPVLPHTLSSLPQIPVVDFKKLQDELFSNSELQVMHNACQEWGFFQLTNHGVDLVLLEKLKSEIQEFFDLPMEVKKKFVKESGELEGYGHRIMVSDQKLDWGDLFYLVTWPTYLRNPHLLSKLPTTLREAIEAYSSELQSLTMKILHKMAKALNMKNEEMETLFDDEGWQVMSMNYYPPCPQPELVTGICPHSDSSALTILLEVNGVEGVEIKKDGVWIPVSLLPNAFLVNIGDILEIITNGTYRSIEHRGVTNSTKERLSIVTFQNPKQDGDIRPAPSLVSQENPARFKRIGVTEYFKNYFSKDLDGRSNLDTMRI